MIGKGDDREQYWSKDDNDVVVLITLFIVHGIPAHE